LVQEILLNTKELEPPEPIQLVMEKLPTLNSNNYIKMIHRMEPKMLYPYLIKNNFQYKIEFILDDVYIYIWHDSFDQNKILE